MISVRTDGCSGTPGIFTRLKGSKRRYPIRNNHYRVAFRIYMRKVIAILVIVFFIGLVLDQGVLGVDNRQGSHESYFGKSSNSPCCERKRL